MRQEETVKTWTPTNPAFNPNEPMQVGGQAVIEGVMMRAKGMIATAVRRPDGKIVVKKEEFHSLAERYPILRIPILRGAVCLLEMMYIGIKTLNYSAEIALEDPSGDETAPKKSQSTFSLLVTLIVALALGIGIFFFIKARNNKKNHYLIYAGLFLALSFLIKEYAYYYCIILFCVFIYTQVKQKKYYYQFYEFHFDHPLFQPH